MLTFEGSCKGDFFVKPIEALPPEKIRLLKIKTYQKKEPIGSFFCDI